MGEAVSNFYPTTHEELKGGRPFMGAADESWFAVHTRPRHEKRVAAGLQEKGISTFLPLFSEKHRWSDRARVVHLPVFPSYVFIRMVESTRTRVSVLQTNGVTRFVGVRGKGVPIPDEQIDAVRTILEQGIPFSLSPFLHVGQRVRIRGGSLEGVQGILMGQNGDQSVVISVDIIQRSVAVRIAGYRVEPA